MAARFQDDFGVPDEFAAADGAFFIINRFLLVFEVFVFPCGAHEFQILQPFQKKHVSVSTDTDFLVTQFLQSAQNVADVPSKKMRSGIPVVA